MTSTHKTPLISPSVLFAILSVSQLGMDFLNLPTDAARTCGPSGYWTIVVAFILFLPVILLSHAMSKRFGDSDLFAAASKALGQPLSTLGNLIYLFTFFAWLILSIRDSGDLVLTYMLNHTPLWAVLIPFLALVGYITVNGLTGIGRMAAFVLIPTFAFRVFMQLLSFQQMDWMQVQPVFSAKPMDYLIGGLDLINGFLPLTAVFLIYPYLSRREKLLPVSMGAAASCLIVFFLEIFGTIGIFGPEFLQRFVWPNLVVIHRINIPYLVLEQVGLLFLIVWLTMFVVGCSFYVYIMGWGLKRQFPAFNFKITVLVLLVLLFLGGILLPQSAVVIRIFEGGRRWGPIPVIAYPILVYLVALLRGIRGGEHEA